MRQSYLYTKPDMISDAYFPDNHLLIYFRPMNFFHE